MEILTDVLYIHFVLFALSFVFILKNKSSDRSQKILQTIFSLILILLGPIITLGVHLSDLTTHKTPSDRYIGQSIDESPYAWYWPFP